MDVLKKTEILRRCPPFSYMSEADTSLFAQSSRLVCCDEGTMLYREKDKARGLIVIISGSVKSYTYEPDGRMLVEAYAVAGDCIGWLSIVDAGVRTAEAVATERLRYLTIRKADVELILKNNPYLWKAVARIMAIRLRNSKSSRRGLAVNHLEKRVARTIRDLMEVKDDNSNKVVLSIRQQEIADICMSSRQSVNKCLKKMESALILNIGYQKITIIDADRIKAMASLVM